MNYLTKFGIIRKDQKTQRGPSGIGYKLTSDGHYDLQDKRLTNCGYAEQDQDVITKNYLLNENGNFNARMRRIENVAPPSEANDAISKQYLDLFLPRRFAYKIEAHSIDETGGEFSWMFNNTLLTKLEFVFSIEEGSEFEIEFPEEATIKITRKKTSFTRMTHDRKIRFRIKTKEYIKGMMYMNAYRLSFNDKFVMGVQ